MFLMIIAAVCAYFQMVKLDVNESAHNSLDNFLCLMCLPAFFVYGIFSVIAGVIFGRVLAVVGIILEVRYQGHAFPPANSGKNCLLAGSPSGDPDGFHRRWHVEVQQHQDVAQEEAGKRVCDFPGDLQCGHVDHADVRAQVPWSG